MPVAVSKCLGWRTYLPTVQILIIVAEWCAEITASKEARHTDWTAHSNILNTHQKQYSHNQEAECSQSPHARIPGLFSTTQKGTIMPKGTKGIRRTGSHIRNTGPSSSHSRRPSSKPRQPQTDTNTTANAKRKYEHYMALARDAASTSNAIEIENFYQHAEHYLRQMREQTVQE